MFWLNYSDFHMIEIKTQRIMFCFVSAEECKIHHSRNSIANSAARAEFRLYFPQSPSKFVTANPPLFFAFKADVKVLDIFRFSLPCLPRH